MKVALDALIAAVVVGVTAALLYCAKAWIGLGELARDFGLERDTMITGLSEASITENGPLSLLAAASFGPALALALFVLVPAWLVVRRRHAGWPRWRHAATWGGLGALAAAVLLESIDPVLSLPSVPLGPRALLNHAFELVGYGFVNALAYVTAIGGALLFGLRRRRADARA